MYCIHGKDEQDFCRKCKNNTNKTPIIESMVDKFREAENLYLESRTEMAEHTETQRQKFYNRAMALKEEASKTMTWLVDVVGIEEDYINEILQGEGI